MKKMLLSAMAVALTLTSFAQAGRMSAVKPSIRSTVRDNRIEPAFVTGLPYRYINPTEPNPSASILTVGRTLMSHSGSLYGVLNGYTSPISYNQALGAIMYTNRATINSGKIRLNVSTDGGATWDTSKLALDLIAANGSFGRYPSGAIINPAGNTDIKNAFGVVAGPCTDGADWVSHYFGAKKLDSLGTSPTEIYTFKDPGSGFTPNTPTVSEGGFATIYYGANDNAGRYRIGTYSSDSVESNLYADMNGVVVATYSLNEASNVFTGDFKTVLTPNIEYYSGGAMTWSENGQVGYVVAVGRDTSIAKQPIALHVWKTVNAGNTWAKLPDFDHTSHLDYTFLNGTTDTSGTTGNFQINLPTTGGLGGTRPIFNAARFTEGEDFDMVVDKNNELHVFAPVLAAFSNDPDSVDFSWSSSASLTNAELFDTYTTNGGTAWRARYMADMKTRIVTNAASPVAVGYDHRIQASRTTDGRYLVCTWLDTDPALDTINLYPNIHAWAADVQLGFYIDSTMNLTANTNFDSDNFWYFASHTIFVDGTNLVIPASVSVPGSASATVRSKHFFVDGLTVPIPRIIGTRDTETKKGFSVTPAYPNPASTNAVVKVNLDNAANVTIKVTNVIGQTLYTNAAQMDAGTQNININTANYPQGLYFYTVTVNGQSIANKLVVE
jgi:hypothetical protein